MALIILEIMLSVIGIWLFIYAGYYVILGLFAFKKKKVYPLAEPKNKFGIVIAARNEEAVIGNLIESLLAQDYPREMFEIFVIPNNCTDDTEKVAISAGATIFNCCYPVRSKADALKEFFIWAEENKTFDAFCIFDADNVVEKNYLKQMNNAYSAGEMAAQGYRNSKNPTDTWITGCYTIYYYIINRFNNRAKTNCGISAVVNGSGFMVSAELLRELGGWNTSSMTEDIEFTIQCALHGQKVAWVEDAVFYDEQPLTFKQSWTQRKRWSTGLMQCFDLYFKRLIKALIKKPNGSCLDMAIFVTASYVQIFYTLSMVLSMSIAFIKWSAFVTAAIEFDSISQVIPQLNTVFNLLMHMDYSLLYTTLIALVTCVLERHRFIDMFRGILTFWVFIQTWTFINITCIFKKQTVWEPIAHTKNVKIEDLN